MKQRLVFVSALLILFVMASCHVGRFFIYNFADIRDYKKFPKKELLAASQPFHFIDNKGSSTILFPDIWKKGKDVPFEPELKRSNTVAFLVIRNDSVLYEWYAPKYSQKSIVPSFSMAKSFISAMIGMAIDEGKIKSTAEPITNYIDFLDKEKFGRITIQHLLDMQSGIKNNESYINPFGDVAKYYYGRHLKKYMHRIKIKEEPGKNFEYISLNTQLLALILEKATGRTPTNYLQEKIWTPLGMEHDASWSIDSKRDKTEKAFCCINARARDFAKFGRLYLNNGNWNGKQIVSSKWVDESVNFRVAKNYYLYSNQWWHTRNFYPASDTTRLQKPWILFTSYHKGKTIANVCQPTGDYFAEGHLGQFIYVSPKHHLIIVRLGKNYGGLYWAPYLKKLAAAN